MLLSLPGYEFLSAPLWLIHFLHVLTLTLHFVAMNVMVGGLVLVLFGRFQKKMIQLLPTVMAATITLGVAPLLFTQLVYAKPFYSATVVSAWFWIMIMVVAIASYYFLYGTAFSEKKYIVYLSFALIGFLYISFVHSATYSMAENADLYHSLYAKDQSGWVINTAFGSYIFRWLHMLARAVMAGGFVAAFLGKDNKDDFVIAKRFFVAALILGLGFWLLDLMQQTNEVFMGCTACFVIASVVLAIVSLPLLFKKKFLFSGLSLFLSLFSMVGARHVIRLLSLKGFDPAGFTFQPQWSIFVVFLVCFVIALAVVGYMLKLFFEK